MVFEKAFATNKALVKQFQDFEEGRLAGKTTDFFYKEIAEPFVAALAEPLAYTWLDIRTYEKPLRNQRKDDDTKLIPFYKILSPEHLLKLPFQNDSNSLDRGFYAEFLHLTGLAESKEGGKKVIGRLPEGERQKGSLLELTIVQLDAHDEIYNIPNAARFGETYAERLYNVALELCITWINRILFLKLLEAQLLNYHRGNKEYSFLNLDKVPDFDALDSLFFRVLARKPAERDDELNKLFAHVPYLNSSLFEATELERQTVYVSNLGDDAALPLLPATVVKDVSGKKRKGTLGTLAYLFSFLDAYDFSSEGSEDIQEENKALINASVLGLIFEKINGYKDGSFFTPGFITMYMCRETLRRAVLQKKFCEAKGWQCSRFEQLYDKIEDKQEANRIINSLKICDPAVGSGHFLVSALNEIIAIKSELKILLDREGRTLRDYHVEVVNDELVVLDEEGKPFAYKPQSKESQRVQEALFHEKQLIIENCLFGVDINPNSVKICRLRLWIELLKNAYYQQAMAVAGAETGGFQAESPQTASPLAASPICYAGEMEKGSAEMRPEFRETGSAGELQTLPNIDINIKQGNSLISRFALDADLGKALKKSRWNIESYKIAVQSYRHARNKEEKRELEGLINDIKGNFRSEINKNDKKVLRLNRLRGEHYNLVNQGLLFGGSKSEEKARKKKQKEQEKEIEKLDGQIEEIRNNKIFEGAFEWRFEFPEVLNDEGEFRGFDAIIGNPPYIRVQELDKKLALSYNSSYNLAYQNYDIYILFIEKGLELIRETGLLSYIMPTKFIKTAYGDNLRNLIKKETLLHLFIDFADLQVFEDATTYVGIFSFSKSEKEHFLHQKVLNINEIKYNPKLLPYKQLKDDVWVLQDEQGSKLFAKLNKNLKLKDHTKSVFVGLQTSADPVYILKNDEEGGYFSKFTNKTYYFKADILKPLLKGAEIKRYSQPKELFSLIFPYKKVNNKYKVIAEEEFSSLYPDIWDYLLECQEKLKGRENGKMDVPEWWAYVYPKNLEAFDKPKIMTQVLSIHSSLTYDGSGYYYFVGGGTAGGYGIVLKDTSKGNYHFVLGLLNSRIVEWYIHSVASPFRGGYYAYSRATMEGVPIPLADEEAKARITFLVVQILCIKQADTNADTSALEAEIDQLVYQLYGLTEEEIQLVEESVR